MDRISQLVFVTGNLHKIEEVKQILSSKGNQAGLPKIVGLSDLGFSQDIPETHNTFAENALQKASFIYDKFGIPCFAEDSGLEVNALYGAPGVRSARYAGPEKNHRLNIDLLLKKLEGKMDRSAQFKAVIALIIDPRKIYYFTGIIQGHILKERRGTGGFGYDPVFQPMGCPYSFAEMEDILKNKISHRALAIEKLIHFLTHSL